MLLLMLLCRSLTERGYLGAQQAAVGVSYRLYRSSRQAQFFFLVGLMRLIAG